MSKGRRFEWNAILNQNLYYHRYFNGIGYEQRVNRRHPNKHEVRLFIVRYLIRHLEKGKMGRLLISPPITETEFNKIKRKNQVICANRDCLEIYCIHRKPHKKTINCDSECPKCGQTECIPLCMVLKN